MRKVKLTNSHHSSGYHKTIKIGTHKNDYHTCPKSALMCLKDADGKTNSVIWVSTVCSVLSIPEPRIFLCHGHALKYSDT